MDEAGDEAGLAGWLLSPGEEPSRCECVFVCAQAVAGELLEGTAVSAMADIIVCISCWLRLKNGGNIGRIDIGIVANDYRHNDNCSPYRLLKRV